ncbi:MAG: F-box protein [Chlamydiia bacterium]|nr:F-box protein [Chlamydiia bacterium]
MSLHKVTDAKNLKENPKSSYETSEQSPIQSLSQLPTEVLLLILSKIHDAATLKSTSLASHQFYRLIFDRRRTLLKTIWNIEVSSSKLLGDCVFKAIAQSLYRFQITQSLDELLKTIDQIKIWAISFGGGFNFWIKKNKTLFSALCEVLAHPNEHFENIYPIYLNFLKWALASGGSLNLKNVAIPPLFAFLMPQPQSQKNQDYLENVISILLEWGASATLQYHKTDVFKNKISALDYAKQLNRTRLYEILWNSLNDDEKAAQQTPPFSKKLQNLWKWIH